MTEPSHPFHTQSVDEVLNALEVRREQGLSAHEAKRRFHRYGPNRLPEAQARNAWSILLDQMKSVVLIVLAVAAALALAFRQWAEGMAIAAVLLVNGAIGFISEWRAVQSMTALQKMGQPKVRIRREGQAVMIPIQKLVPGDIVLMEGGDVAPADLRVFESNALRVDESALTGESVSVNKVTDPVEADSPIADRHGMIFKGTTITEGSGEGVVVATGMATELGRISAMTEEAEEEVTPLERRLDQLGQRLAGVALGLALLIGAAGLFAGQPMVLMIETALALGLAAIPEGLPIVATMALARGMWLMAKRQALINRLTAVETLGATRVICTDKTGTLTENRMTVRKIVTPDKEFDLESLTSEDGKRVSQLPTHPTLHRIVDIGILCTNASLGPGEAHDEQEEAQGDPTEIALLRAGAQWSRHRHVLLQEKPEVREISFDPDLMMMATVHRVEETFEVAVKGAPAAVLEVCETIVSDNGEESQPLNDQDRQHWIACTQRLAGEGLRMLAMADKRVESQDVNPYENLCFLGLVGMVDPPRPGVSEAIAACQQAGIRVVMVTGDQPETARAIGAQVGLIPNQDSPVLQGRDIKRPDALSPEERDTILKCHIFARVSPEQKLNLIEIFQTNEETVAMTGDGINDTPALKKADIGVAMGRRGTDAAKQVSDMVLKDDAFSSIVAAVEQGRIIFSNIRKSVLFMLCTNGAEILAVAVASLANVPLPLRPLQILYLNVVTDVFPALALGVGKGTSQVMEAAPRPRQESILTTRHWMAISGWSLLMATCVLGALAGGLYWFELDIPLAVTVSFLTLGFAKLGFVFNLRDRGSSWWKNDVMQNPWLWGSIGLCTVLLILAVYLPGLTDVLQTQALDRGAWMLVLGIAIIPMVVGQVIRAVPHTRTRGHDEEGHGLISPPQQAAGQQQAR